MPTSCLCSRIQVKIACLCLASACESFCLHLWHWLWPPSLFFFSLWAMFSLFWELKYSFLEQTNSKKPIACVHVWKGQYLFCCPGPHFSLGCGNSQSISLLLLRGCLALVLSHHRHEEALSFAPGSFFKAPRECCGRLLGTNLECSSQISLGLFSLGCCRLFLSVSLVS